MDKRVPRNPRYAGVRATINSGMTVDKVRVVTTKQYLRRRDESFFRISAGQLHELFAEYEQELFEGVEDNRAHTHDPDNHGPRIVTYDEEASPEYERPYLILDIRPEHEFQQCHLMQARSFPMMFMKQDRTLPELVSFKNREGALIILYETDERQACAAANMMVQRGFDNVYVLSKGLVGFAAAFPSFVEGQPPASPLPSPGGPGAKRGTPASRARMSASGSRRGFSAAGMAQPKSPGVPSPGSRGAAVGGSRGSPRADWQGAFDGREVKSGSASRAGGSRAGGSRAGMSGRESVRSTMSVADSVISRAAQRKNHAAY